MNGVKEGKKVKEYKSKKGFGLSYSKTHDMENLLEESFYIKPLLTPEGHLALGYLLGAWLSFRDSHNMDDPSLDYSSKLLFKALAQYESIMMGKKGTRVQE